MADVLDKSVITEDIMYIPIGIDCSVAFNLQKYGVRKMAFPFDWLRLTDIKFVIDLIQSKFQYFMEKEYLIEDTDIDSTKFPILDGDNMTDDYKKHIIVKNTKLNIRFYHDCESIEDIDNMIEKYNRRITRFYNILGNINIKKVFIRLSKNKDDERLFNKFINDSGITNCSMIYIFITNKMVRECKDWRKEELDWKHYLKIG